MKVLMKTLRIQEFLSYNLNLVRKQSLLLQPIINSSMFQEIYINYYIILIVERVCLCVMGKL